jgi:hypothetical protein
MECGNLALSGEAKRTSRERSQSGVSRTQLPFFAKCGLPQASRVIEVHGEIAEWAIQQSIQAEIPVRGAISFGSFAIQDNIFIGKAVDEAASWHEYADWIGVHLTPSAEWVFRTANLNGLWINYCPPTKTAFSWKPHCVNWTRSWADRVAETEAIKSSFRNLGPIVPEIAGKLTNTFNFIHFVGQTIPIP